MIPIFAVTGACPQYHAAGELPEHAAQRTRQDKLDCQASPVRFLGLMYQKRNSYDIFLMDVELELIDHTQPDVTRANTATTAYNEQKWTSDPMDLMESVRNGSFCSSILLTDRGLLNRDEWIASLGIPNSAS